MEPGLFDVCSSLLATSIFFTVCVCSKLLDIFESLCSHVVGVVIEVYSSRLKDSRRTCKRVKSNTSFFTFIGLFESLEVDHYSKKELV